LLINLLVVQDASYRDNGICSTKSLPFRKLWIRVVFKFNLGISVDLTTLREVDTVDKLRSMLETDEESAELSVSSCVVRPVTEVSAEESAELSVSSCVVRPVTEVSAEESAELSVSSCVVRPVTEVSAEESAELSVSSCVVRTFVAEISCCRSVQLSLWLLCF